MMEMTDDMLRRIANSIIDIMTHVMAQRLQLTKLGVNPQETDKLIRELHDSPHYQIMCDELLERLKGGQ